MREDKHLTESEVFELLSQKLHSTQWKDKHLLECSSCLNEAYSLYKTVKSLETVKLSREERLRMLTREVTSEISRQSTRRRIRVPAMAAALVLLTFGIYFYTQFFSLAITTPNSSIIPSVVSYGDVNGLNAKPKEYVQTHSVSVLGEHTKRTATSQSIGSSVVHKGEVRDDGQSQQDSLSVASNYITISYSKSF